MSGNRFVVPSNPIEGPDATFDKSYDQVHVLEVLDVPGVIAGEPDVVHDYLFSRCLTIAGGTSEIVRNLIAQRILRLPRDPAPK